MAFPSIVSQANNSNDAATTSHTLTLPGSLVSGNQLLAFITKVGGGAATWPAGWTELGDTSHESLAIRVIDGTEPASITVTTGSSVESACGCYQISGAESPTVQAPQIVGPASGTGTSVNPPGGTPTGGPKDFLWIGWGSYFDATRTVSSYPANYDLGQLEDQATTNSGIALCARQLNATSENPDAIVVSGTTTWSAFTIAVHPAPSSTGPGGLLGGGVGKVGRVGIV